MYKINYFNSRPDSVIREDSAYIPFDIMNTDFLQFLEWNKTGKLDYKTPIAVKPPAPAETLEEKIANEVKKQIKNIVI